jgi:ABC-2 type transport system ATP-binding protein
LDPKQIIEVRELIKELGKERTIILSTHILSEAQQVCGRVLIINEGRIVAEGTPESLTALLKGGERIYIELARPSPDVKEELMGIEGVKSVEAKDGGYEIECALGKDKREEIAEAAVKHKWGLLEMKKVGMSLEEIFLELTEE